MRDFLRWFFSPWVLGGSLLIAIVLLGGTAALLWFTRPEPTPIASSTAVLNVIPGATATPVLPTATPAPPTPTAAPQEGVPPSPLPGTINLDAYVQISGTGGDGLRLRVDPGLQTEVRTLGAEAEVFLVKDGPREVDGYTWWYLEGVYDAARRGWAVSNYLSIVQEP